MTDFFSSPLPMLGLLGLGVLIQGVWLIWDGTLRTSRRLSARWRKFHPTVAGVSTEGRLPGARADRDAPGRGGRPFRLLRGLDRILRDARLGWRASNLILAGLALGVPALLMGAALGAPLALMIPAWLLLLAAPWFHALRITRRRVALMQEQIADAVDLVARALRAGHALASALRMVADQAPAPISEEFATVCEQIGFGVPADEALRDMAARSRSEDLRYFVIAVLLQRETGGNLAELLDNIAHLVRHRQQLRQSVRALSAEGRLSAWILGILPFALAGAIALINPELLSLLWTDPAGRIMSASSLVMMGIGAVVMRQMIRVRA